MARVKRAVNAQKKRRSVLEKASGYRGQRSRLAAEIHARHLEEARKKAVSRSAAASRAKQAAYQSAKSRNIAANVAAKEGRGASR